jgi:cobalamin-dependent methionine synthase I
MDEALSLLDMKVCYTELFVTVSEGICDFGYFNINSKSLAKNLFGCERVILFAATVGIGLDRLITKHSRLSPLRALFAEAVGTERVEAVCDALTLGIAEEYGKKTKPRFSVGYGDAPLSAQKDIITLLDTARLIGVSLNESLVMSPSKSVTAFMGIEK